MIATSAAATGLARCRCCGLVSAFAAAEECPRCSVPLQLRMPGSLSRTWAYLLAAYILYIPANLLPIMETRSIFSVQQDTIMSGVIYLWVSGAWPLATIVFVASIIVPLAKLLALTLLCVTVQMKTVWRAKQRTELYLFVEFVGRWSMLDVFVVTVLVALVQAQSLATVMPGSGVVAFAAVVVISMLAAESFDPRLIWDPMNRSGKETSRGVSD